MLFEITVSLLLITGSIMIMLGALGVIRFRDPLCRAHALGKASSFGICLMLGGLWMALGNEASGLKLLLVIVLSLLTIPLASHFISLYVYSLQEAGLPPNVPRTGDPGDAQCDQTNIE